jgi:steroid delta-isomerase-like uncharacterized protein
MATDTSRLEQNKEIVRRYTDEVFNEKRYDVIDQVVADDFVSHNSALPTDITSREEFKETVTGIHAAFPDLEARIDDIVAEEDMVVTRTIEGGTHQGEFAGLDATGRSFEVEAINVYHVEDGTITENWVQFDTMGMMEQLGVA